MKQPSTWRCALASLALLASLPLVDLASAGEGGYSIRNGTVASGGSVSAVDCYSLVSTIGEAVAGSVSAGEYRLTSGFPATLGEQQVSTGTFTVFKDSFEGNDQEGCTP